MRVSVCDLMVCVCAYNSDEKYLNATVTRISLDLWMNFSGVCRCMGAPIVVLKAHALARTMCACKTFSLDPQGNHVLTCKEHTAATRGHNHDMDVLAQLAHNTG